MQLLTTTGAAIAVGTNVDFAGAYRDDTATTITIKNGATTILTLSATQYVLFAEPVGLSGPLTATSSGGSMHIVFRQRSV